MDAYELKHVAYETHCMTVASAISQKHKAHLLTSSKIINLHNCQTLVIHTNAKNDSHRADLTCEQSNALQQLLCYCLLIGLNARDHELIQL